ITTKNAPATSARLGGSGTAPRSTRQAIAKSPPLVASKPQPTMTRPSAERLVAPPSATPCRSKPYSVSSTLESGRIPVLEVQMNAWSPCVSKLSPTMTDPSSETSKAVASTKPPGRSPIDCIPVAGVQRKASQLVEVANARPTITFPSGVTSQALPRGLAAPGKGPKGIIPSLAVHRNGSAQSGPEPNPTTVLPSAET